MLEPKIKKGELITPSLFKRFFYNYADPLEQGPSAVDITPFPSCCNYYVGKTPDGRTVLSRSLHGAS